MAKQRRGDGLDVEIPTAKGSFSFSIGGGGASTGVGFLGLAALGLLILLRQTNPRPS